MTIFFWFTFSLPSYKFFKLQDGICTSYHWNSLYNTDVLKVWLQRIVSPALYKKRIQNKFNKYHQSRTTSGLRKRFRRSECASVIPTKATGKRTAAHWPRGLGQASLCCRPVSDQEGWSHTSLLWSCNVRDHAKLRCELLWSLVWGAVSATLLHKHTNKGKGLSVLRVTLVL